MSPIPVLGSSRSLLREDGARVRFALILLAFFAGTGSARSVLRGGLWDVYAESGFQNREDPNWTWTLDSSSFLDSYWEEHPTTRPGRTWTLGAGMFLNDNFRLGLRWSAVADRGRAPAFLDSSVVSLETAFFSHPSGPLSGQGAVRLGLAPGFSRRDPPGTAPLYVAIPARVYAVAAGVRWIPLENVALDCDLMDVELWSGSVRNTWHVSWLVPRLSILF